jgi:4-amino-4-deoxychorismate lyase
MKISLNGSICDEQEAVVSVYDHGFLYGIGLFETFRTYKGKAFLLEKHLERLRQGCAELWIELQLNVQQINMQVTALLAANELQEGYFRLSVSAGTDLLGLPDRPYAAPTVLLYVKPLPLQEEKLYINGKALQLLRLRRNSPEGGERLKSFHYMNNILAKRELSNYPWAAGAEGLFLNGAGFVAEGIVSNMFFIRDGVCHTPHLDTGILPGITRALVIDLAEQAGVTVETGLYNWEGLLAADEIFITNSIQEIVPITTLFNVEGKGYLISEGKTGPFTRRLRQMYRERTNEIV